VPETHLQGFAGELFTVATSKRSFGWYYTLPKQGVELWKLRQ